MHPNRKIHLPAGPEGSAVFFARIISIMLETFGILNIWAYALGALIIVMIPARTRSFVLKTSIVDGRRAASLPLRASHGRRRSGLPRLPRHRGLVLAHPEVFFWLKILGAAYLAWLGGKAIHARSLPRRPKRPKANPEVVVKKSRSLVKVYRNALCAEPHEPEVDSLLRLLLPQFIDPAFDNPAISYTILALILNASAWPG